MTMKSPSNAFLCGMGFNTDPVASKKVRDFLLGNFIGVSFGVVEFPKVCLYPVVGLKLQYDVKQDALGVLFVEGVNVYVLSLAVADQPGDETFGQGSLSTLAEHQPTNFAVLAAH